jgi:hypothetical protein
MIGIVRRGSFEMHIKLGNFPPILRTPEQVPSRSSHDKSFGPICERARSGFYLGVHSE